MNSIVRLSIVACVVLSSGLATASSEDGAATEILSCFHPFGTYVDSHWGDNYPIGEHTFAQDVYVRYRQLDDKVRRMPFQLQVRVVDGDKMWRVVPDDEHDTGDFGPSASCYMRSWQTEKKGR